MYEGGQLSYEGLEVLEYLKGGGSFADLETTQARLEAQRAQADAVAPAYAPAPPQAPLLARIPNGATVPTWLPWAVAGGAVLALAWYAMRGR